MVVTGVSICVVVHHIGVHIIVHVVLELRRERGPVGLIARLNDNNINVRLGLVGEGNGNWYIRVHHTSIHRGRVHVLVVRNSLNRGGTHPLPLTLHHWRLGVHIPIRVSRLGVGHRRRHLLGRVGHRRR